MRNPIRLKNLSLRFLPVAAIGLIALAGAEPAAASELTRTPGSGAIVLGIALRSWAAGHLSKRERLSVSGPYAHHRHPLYAGTLLLGLGFACLLGGAASWVLVGATALWFFLDYFPRKERSESALLEAEFGAAYVAYRIAVPALLPRLPGWEPSRELAAAVPLSSGWSMRSWSDNNELGTLLGVGLGIALVAAAAMRNFV